MRLVVLAAVLLALVAGASAAGSPSAATSLRVTYWPDSAKPGQSWTWTVRCGPAGGTLARPGRACARLAAGGPKLFAPPSTKVFCTEIYGGPQLARIVGTVNGRRVRATFSRTNGCEISRWQRISPWLVPAGGAI